MIVLRIKGKRLLQAKGSHVRIDEKCLVCGTMRICPVSAQFPSLLLPGSMKEQVTEPTFPPL